jgi:hypothetical protein
VSVVRLTVFSDPSGTDITVTAVTLIELGVASSFNFCGNQISQFPMNQFVTAQFTPGNTCATVVSVR